MKNELSHINRESIDAIRTAVWELEKAGYITRRQGRDEKGKMTAIEYTIYEQPQPPLSDNPALENPTPVKPILENPTTENPAQLNKEIQRTDLPTKEKIMTDEQSTHSIPILSQSDCDNRFTSTPYDGEAAKEPERKRKEASTQTAVEIYRKIIKDNIDYDILILDNGMEKERMDKCADSNTDQYIWGDFLCRRHNLFPCVFHAVFEIEFFLCDINRFSASYKFFHIVFKAQFLNHSTAHNGNHKPKYNISYCNFLNEYTH